MSFPRPVLLAIGVVRCGNRGLAGRSVAGSGAIHHIILDFCVRVLVTQAHAG